MGDVFIILMLLSIILMIIGIIKPGLVIYWGKKRTRIRAFITYFSSTIIFFILFGITVENQEEKDKTRIKGIDNKNDSTQIDTANFKDIKLLDKNEGKISKKEQKKLDQLKEQQKELLAFEQKIFDIEKTATYSIESFQNIIKKIEQGEANIYDAYKAANFAKEKCKNVQYSLNSTNVSKKIPKDIRKLLKEAVLEISTAYMIKAEAFEKARKYLDEKKLSSLLSYQEKMKDSDRFIITAIAKIAQAKEKMGIDILKNE